MIENNENIMSDSTRDGLLILEAAVLLGILGDVLLRSTPLGLNVFLWITALVSAIAFVFARRRGADAHQSEKFNWLYIPLVLFAAFFVWRDSNVLLTLDALAILLTLVLISLRGQNMPVRLASFSRYAFAAFSTAVDAAFAPFQLLFKDVKWATIPRNGWTKHLFAVLRGLAIAAPVLLVFGALFMAADAVFEGIVKNTFNISPDVIVAHGFFICFFTWIVAGFLRGATTKSEFINAVFYKDKIHATLEAEEKETAIAETNTDRSPVEKVIHQSDEPQAKISAETKPEFPETKKKEHGFFSLGLIETSVVLSLMNLLFLSFVVVQIRYFFGGAQLVQQITNLTYAEYARRGFFELVWVALLVLPILLIIEFLLRKDNPLNVKIYRSLAGGQIALLFVIMSSALSRMFLYQNEYGLTELRVYTTAFMFWLAVVFVLFCTTVLVGKRNRFAFTTYVSALVFVAALHFVNPDNLISRVNLERLAQGKYFDAPYVSTLSADAIPVLIDKIPEMTFENKCVLQINLQRRRDYEARKDWRSWNWARRSAWDKVETQIESWQTVTCPKIRNTYSDGF